MTLWLLLIILLASAYWLAVEALWRLRTATSRRDVALAVLFALGAAGVFMRAWEVGSWR